MMPTLLIVDDNADNRAVLCDTLDGEGYTLREAADGLEALEEVEQNPPDLILLDIMMPKLDGIECSRKLQASEVTRHIPIILVTALIADEKVVEGLAAGATDYIAKPFVGAVVRARVRSALRTKMARDEVQRSHTEVEHLAEQLREKNHELANLALKDSLTGLPNRALLMDRLTQVHARARRNPGERFALLFLDFDGFKLINDSLGHEAGDDLLISIADRLREEIREVDTVASLPSGNMPSRLGGDEFVILLDQLRDSESAIMIADRLQRSLAMPHSIAGQEVISTASIGIATNDRDYETADEMLRDADTAMYHAKESGRARSVQFDERMHDEVLARVQRERELRAGIKKHQLLAEYQPILNLTDGILIGCEAIVRWHHPDHGVLDADEFMPLADEIGLVEQICEHVIITAIRQMGQWQRSHSDSIAMKMTTRLWEKQLCRAGYVDLIRNLFIEESVEPSSLCFEIPETIFAESSGRARQAIDELRALGVRLSMDGCGRGHSVFTGFHDLPIDILKIGRTVIRNLDSKSHNAALVHAVITLAHNLGMQVAAEGIESTAQLAQLQAHECDYGQGDVFSGPLTAEQFEHLIEQVRTGGSGNSLMDNVRMAS